MRSQSVIVECVMVEREQPLEFFRIGHTQWMSNEWLIELLDESVSLFPYINAKKKTLVSDLILLTP